MFSPYVSLQEQLIKAFRRLLKYDTPTLSKLAKKYCIENEPNLNPADFEILQSAAGEQLVEDYPEQAWREAAILATFKEQLDLEGGIHSIKIRNLLGKPMCSYEVVDITGYISRRGSGSYVLRTDLFAQPGALKVGDILATGEIILSPPRQGGNGSVLLHLSGIEDGVWLPYHSRTGLALLAAAGTPTPEGLVE